MKQEDRETLLGFEEAVAAIPNVLQAQRLFGAPPPFRTTDLIGSAPEWRMENAGTAQEVYP